MLNIVHLNFLRLDIERLLNQFSGQKVLYLPNPGNAGDSLIAVGTYQAFRRRNVEIEIVNLDDDVTGQTVFLAGGGNFVPLYDDIKKAYDKFLGKAKKIILLPHTIRGNEDTLIRMDQSCILYCRDVESFNHVKSINPSLDARLSHDMAFHADVQEILSDEKIKAAANPILNEKLNFCGLSSDIIASWPTAEFLRSDSESLSTSPQTDLDVSDLFMLGVEPKTAEIATWCFLKTIGFAKSIVTDRLHVGIAAFLLGIPCTLRDNSYGKNQSIYEYSLNIALDPPLNSQIRFKSAPPNNFNKNAQIRSMEQALERRYREFQIERGQLSSKIRGIQGTLASTSQLLLAATIEKRMLAATLQLANENISEQANCLANTKTQLEKITAELTQLRENIDKKSQSTAYNFFYFLRTFSQAIIHIIPHKNRPDYQNIKD